MNYNGIFDDKFLSIQINHLKNDRPASIGCHSFGMHLPTRLQMCCSFSELSLNTLEILCCTLKIKIYIYIFLYCAGGLSKGNKDRWKKRNKRQTDGSTATGYFLLDKYGSLWQERKKKRKKGAKKIYWPFLCLHSVVGILSLLFFWGGIESSKKKDHSTFCNDPNPLTVR